MKKKQNTFALMILSIRIKISCLLFLFSFGCLFSLPSNASSFVWLAKSSLCPLNHFIRYTPEGRDPGAASLRSSWLFSHFREAPETQDMGACVFLDSLSSLLQDMNCFGPLVIRQPTPLFDLVKVRVLIHSTASALLLP